MVSVVASFFGSTCLMDSATCRRYGHGKALSMSLPCLASTGSSENLSVAHGFETGSTIRVSGQPKKIITRNLASPSRDSFLPWPENKFFRLSASKKKSLPFYVTIPADTVTKSHTISHCRAIRAGLHALKVLGIDGVVMQVHWGIVEGYMPGQYEWSAYSALVDMIQAADLKVLVQICLHAQKSIKEASSIDLPRWIYKIGDNDPDIFFTDHRGNRFKDCLSFSIDTLPLFEGRTPLQMYSGLLQSFRSAFSQHIGSTIVGVIIGLGPDGELKYPAFQNTNWKFQGVGNFQCYDKYMLTNLKQHSLTLGCPEWGLEFQDDPKFSYSHCPNDLCFFQETCGSWNTPYGDFFLTWYSNQLIGHGDRMLSLTRNIFKEDDIVIAGKLPAIHWLYETKSHAAELTAGYYNTESRDGYDAVMEMFSRTSSLPILASIESSNADHPVEARSSPESLFLQIRKASLKHGVPLAGENSCGENIRFQTIIDNVHLTYSSELPSLSSFIFKSMGQSLFSPGSWHHFVKFFRSIKEYDMGATQKYMLQDAEIALYNYIKKQLLGA